MSNRDRFEKFTERAKKVLSLAQEEAQRFQHNYIGTEHLLLGLVREESGVAAKVLKQLGIELQRVRTSVEFIIGRGDRIVLGNIGLTPRAKKVIELAVDEAHLLNHHYIGTEHILLGLLREGEGIAAGVLESLGAHVRNVRIATLRELNVDEKQIEAMVPSTSNDTPRSRMSNQPSGLRSWSYTSTAGYILAPELEKIMSLAEEEARQLQYNKIRPEHLLLSLIREEEAITAPILRDLGIDLTRTHTAVEQSTGLGEQPVEGHIKPTPLAMASVLLAIDEADRLQQTPINAAHLLLGLTRETQGIIPDVLSSLGVDLATIRSKTLEAIS